MLAKVRMLIGTIGMFFFTFSLCICFLYMYMYVPCACTLHSPESAVISKIDSFVEKVALTL